MNLMEAIAEFEAAHVAEKVVGDEWCVARDVAEEELFSIDEELKGGHFDGRESAPSSLVWVPGNSENGMPLADAPLAAQEVAERFDLEAKHRAWRAAADRWCVASERLRRTRCDSDLDVISKFRALCLDQGSFIPQLRAEHVIIQIRGLVAEAEGNIQPKAA